VHAMLIAKDLPPFLWDEAARLRIVAGNPGVIPGLPVPLPSETRSP
jgi:hypothetical protein